MSEPSKQTLRNDTLVKRTTLSIEDRHKKSRLITTTLLSAPIITQSSAIMLYVPSGSEADPLAVADEALKTGKKVFLPDHMGVIEITGCEVRRGDPSNIDIVLVPGIAFDRTGARIGYGKGWYDHFVNELRPEAQLIGIAFENQLVDKIPRSPHDLTLDIIITDKQVVICRDFC